MAYRLDDLLAIPHDASIEVMPLTAAGADWFAYLAHDLTADISHHPAWGQVFKQAFDLDSLLVIHRTEGRIDGGVPLVLFDQRLTGKALISMPFLNYGGLLADNDRVQDGIVAACRRLLEKAGADYVELRHTGFSIGPAANQTIQNRFAFRLPVNRPSQEIFDSLKKQLRTRLRKAAGMGLSYYHGQERLDDFYGLFATAMKEHGTPVLPKRFFALTLEHLSDHAEIFVAYKDSRPVGGKLVLTFQNRATMTWGCYPDRDKDLLANYYLTWELIQQLAGGPVETLDFGRSSRESGSYTYKSNWQAAEIPIYVDYLAADPGKIPQLKPENPKFKLAIAVWQRLPLALTKLIGPRLARYFP